MNTPTQDQLLNAAIMLDGAHPAVTAWLVRMAEQQAAEPNAVLVEGFGRVAILRGIAVELIGQPAAVPQGWRLVPETPTPKQIKAGDRAAWPFPCAQIYKAMLDTAPTQQALVQFNAAIDFAIEQGAEGAEFLRCWREGDTSDWPEFTGSKT